VYLRIVLFISVFIYALYSCSGDCLSCHPVLKDKLEEKEHILLKECISCHKDDNMEGMTASCGGDCFACHDKDKVINSLNIEAHQKLGECKTCHFQADEVLNFEPKNGTFLIDEVLDIK